MRYSSRQYLEIFTHVLIWLGLYLLAVFTIKTMGVFRQQDNTLFLPLTIGTLMHLVLFYAILLWLIPRYLKHQHPKRFLLEVIGIIVGITLWETLLDYFFLVWLYSTEHEPFEAQLLFNFIIHLVIVSLALGYGFTRHWLVNERRQQQLSQEKLTAEINFLKTQLNPHFLFNVLNMAYSSASQSGDERTADIIEKLAALMRYMLYDSNEDLVPVEKEIDYIRHYIRLQKMRFSDDLPVDIKLDIQGDYTGYRIAPLMLICFIENAFKYGVKLGQPTRILIALHFEQGELVFQVQNQVFRRQQDAGKSPKGIGIDNVTKRLAILYPHKHRLQLGEQSGDFRVNLWMDLRS